MDESNNTNTCHFVSIALQLDLFLATDWISWNYFTSHVYLANYHFTRNVEYCRIEGDMQPCYYFFPFRDAHAVKCFVAVQYPLKSCMLSFWRSA